MLSRVLLILLTVFWITMNVLLWRAEYGRQVGGGSQVPVQVVWRKILTAPDSSSLSILHHGKKIGFCHWATSVGEEMSQLKEDAPPTEGMVEEVTGYRARFEGNLALPHLKERVRLDGSLKLNRRKRWQEFNLRINLPPEVWEIRSVAAERTVRVRMQDAGVHFERVFTFAELENPETLLTEYAGPLAASLLSGLGLRNAGTNGLTLLSAMKSGARLDSLKIGHSSTRTYRLEAWLLDRYQAVVFVSKVGEILRVELPDQVLLVNDQLAGL